MTTKTFFPTLVRSEPVGDVDLATRLEHVCWVLAEDDSAGNAWCEEQGYGGYTSYASLDDLPERFPEFAELKALLDPMADAFAQELDWDMEGLSLELDAIWVNILEPGFGHSNHIHPGSVISGTSNRQSATPSCGKAGCAMKGPPIWARNRGSRSASITP